MANAAITEERRLRPTPRQLERALRISAERATRLAAAFGLKVPGIKRAAPKATQAKPRKPVR